MRNVYSLYDFGNWTDAPAPRAGEGVPYMQLLSVRVLHLTAK